jgi:oxygen-dependent protoporphyrinogen oxidase
MPQYPVGHLDMIAGVRKQVEAKMPHVRLTGAAFRGVGIPDCVRQGQEAAERALAHLSGRALEFDVDRIASAAK